MNDKMNLIEAIARLSRMMRRRSNEQELISPMAHYVLRIVMGNDGIRASKLAKLAGVRPASITDAINRLEKQGYVIREKDEIDSRVKCIFITDKTRKQMEEHTKIKQKRNAEMLACLTEDEAEAFLTTCEKLCAFLESEEYMGGK